MNIKSLFYSLFLLSLGSMSPSPYLEAKADNSSLSRACFKPNWCQIGTRGFSTMDPSNWYEITTFSYPITTPLSINPNRGSTQGNVQLTSTGIRIGQPGNYFVSVEVILANEDPYSYPPIIPIFLIRNGVFNPADNNSYLGITAQVPYGPTLVPFTFSGILENVTAGTTLSLVATNGGAEDPEPLTIVAWGISAFKIPCDPAP